jgi:pimeloyl-ACP methyl ester carboxylesterase
VSQADFWVPLNAHTASRSEPLWYWLPGWSFTATIFEPLLAALPGRHLGLDYRAFYQCLTQSGQTPSFNDAVTLLRQTASADALWVGWSLGGALAHATLSHDRLSHDIQSQAAADITSRIQPRALCTLATGSRFLRQSDTSQQGMDEATFSAFRNGFERFPAKTLKRFLALCCQGAEQPRACIAALSSQQLTEQHAPLLATSLDWLTQYQLDDRQLNNQHADILRLAWYGQHDALHPAGLTSSAALSTIPSCGSSHALLLEQATIPLLQRALLELINASAGKQP